MIKNTKQLNKKHNAIFLAFSAATVPEQSAGHGTSQVLIETDWPNPGTVKFLRWSFLGRYGLFFFHSVPGVCRDRHFVQVLVSLNDRKKYFIIKISFSILSPIFWEITDIAILKRRTFLFQRSELSIRELRHLNKICNI